MSSAALDIFAITFLLYVFQVLLGYFLINREKVEKAKDRLQEIRKKISKLQKEGKVVESEKLLNEMFKLNNEVMKETMKVSMITLFVLFIVFPMLKAKYANSLIKLPISLPFIGNSISWFWWYILSFTAVSLAIKKILKIRYL